MPIVDAQLNRSMSSKEFNPLGAHSHGAALTDA